MGAITERQGQLLKNIVEEYIQTGKPVGSVNLVEKQGLKVSSATVRNEMARLIKEGYLKQPHTSAGRVPSTLGFRYYLELDLKEEELPVLKEVAVKQRLFAERMEPEKVLRQTTLALAEQTGCLALISAGAGRLFSAGAVNLLNYPEFFDIDVTKAVLNLIDRGEDFLNLLKKAVTEKEIHVLVGEELGEQKLTECAFVFAPFSSNKFAGTLAVIGPSRLNYARVIPFLRYCKNLLNELSLGW